MEKDGFEPEAHLYLCAECFYIFSKLILTNPGKVLERGMPAVPTIHPIEGGKVIACKKCKYAKALGYVACLPQLKSRERV